MFHFFSFLPWNRIYEMRFYSHYSISCFSREVIHDMSSDPLDTDFIYPDVSFNFFMFYIHIPATGSPTTTLLRLNSNP